MIRSRVPTGAGKPGAAGSPMIRTGVNLGHVAPSVILSCDSLLMVWNVVGHCYVAAIFCGTAATSIAVSMTFTDR